MDVLALHIEYLLRRHDCVVVPGIGAFLNVEQAAALDDVNGVFRPMTSEVRFNSAVSHDDGLLASSYARRRRVPFADGRDMMRRAVEEMKEILFAEGQVTVGRLGILTAENGVVAFKPFSTPANIAARLGLLPVNTLSHAVKAAEDADDINIYRYHQQQQAATPVAVKPAPDAESHKRFDTERNYYIPVNKLFARMTGIFVIVALIGISVLLPFGRDQRVDQASVVPVRAITQAVQQHTAEPEPVAPIPAQPAAVVPQHNSWHIIVATFHNPDQAQDFINANNDKGYTLSVISSGKTHRVSASDAADKEPLVDILLSKDFQSAFPQAWIFNSDK